MMPWQTFLLVGLATASVAGSPPDTQVEWQRKPGEPWRESPVRLLHDLEGFLPADGAPRLSRFGGNLDGPRREASGFFRTEKIGGRWWTIDPEGFPYVHIGLTSVRPTRHPISTAWLEQRFGSDQAWAAGTLETMRELGFSEIGRWSRLDLLNAQENRLPYTTSLTFMASFGRLLGITAPSYGHVLYPDGIIPVFHEEFEAFAFDYARAELAGREMDPWLIGHFTDNELPMPRDLLERTLRIDPEDPVMGANVREARRWLGARQGAATGSGSLTEADNLDWLGHVMDRYYRIATAALRRHGPNHMNLGSRLHGAGPHIPQVLAAGGRHLDIVSINYYNVWSPADAHLSRWARHCPAPILITEFYIKGEDAAGVFSLRNELGAGWIVRTQLDRGRWYQNFTLRLLEAPQVVGWHYFKYADEGDDSNKGLLNPHYQVYQELADAMAPVHRNAFLLADYFQAAEEPDVIDE